MRNCVILVILLLTSIRASGHPMPGSVVKLSVLEKTIHGEAKMPLVELESAIGQSILVIDQAFFRQYFSNHIRASSVGKFWRTTIQSLTVSAAQDSMVGKYQQVVVRFSLTPPALSDLRKFTFNYDAIIHQVITHRALILVEQDWNNGIQSEESARQIGIVKLDVPTGKIFPLVVSLNEGSAWTGFFSMIKLGMQHIKDGTDHLLFLIVLLLPAMLFPLRNRWAGFGGLKTSCRNLFRIVTAFTIGHSITLLFGALGWVKLPGQPVEILIACSILVSAAHAIYPIFPRREAWVAAGFGLIHGLAFASVLAKLNLSAGTLALSVLGFNLGIEMMQLLIILMIVPWLILLSRTTVYPWVRVPAALLAGVAAVGWIIERISGAPNTITGMIDQATPYALWLIMGLAIGSIALALSKRARPRLLVAVP